MHLESGAAGIAKVPSGASTGKREAMELRDGDEKRYGGKGVKKAISNVLGEIQQAVRGFEGVQADLDEKLILLDGSPNKGRLARMPSSGSPSLSRRPAPPKSRCRCIATSRRRIRTSCLCRC